MRLTIVVTGRPAPQGSKQRGGMGQLLEQSAYLPAWRNAVKQAAYREYRRRGILPEQLPLFRQGTPVIVEQCTFYVGPEQCRAEGTDEPLGAPDVDKLLRGVLDPLGGGRPWSKTARLYADDSQIRDVLKLSKRRPDTGITGALIIISDGRD